MRKREQQSEQSALVRMRQKRDGFNRRFPAHAVPLSNSELVEAARREMTSRANYRAAGIEVRAYVQREVA